MSKIYVELLILILVMFSLFSGCINPFYDPVKKAVEEIDEAIFRLDAANADWQTIVTETRDKMTDNAQSTIKNEVNDVLMRGIAASGTEFKCEVDFLRLRVRQDLIRIRAKYTGEPIGPKVPDHCTIIPSSVDMARYPQDLNQIEINGWDFSESQKASLTLVTSDGKNINVTDHLHVNSHYKMLINLGANGILLTKTSEKLILQYQHGEKYTIPINQAVLPKCKTIEKTIEPLDYVYTPPHTYADQDYDGNGPAVTASVNIHNRGDSLVAEYYMKAQETKSDWTTAEGYHEEIIYKATPGYKIVYHYPTYTIYSYTDTDHEDDWFAVGNGAAREFIFIGDTDEDDEAGSTTSVTVKFNKILVKEQQISNCIP